MEHIEGCDEELVRVLLLVAGEMSGVRPDEVQQAVGRVRRAHARVELHNKYVITLI